MTLSQNLEKALYIFENSQQIIITTHTNPDADALGSALSLLIYANNLNKNVKVINNSSTPANLEFLPFANKIEVYNESHFDLIQNADAIFIVDLNDSRRLKSMEQAVISSKATKVMIDHHINPGDFADIYCVDTDASSTGELIWSLFEFAKSKVVNLDIATNLYAAIMTDTGSFRFPRTTEKVHKIIAEFLKIGANPTEIYEKIYNCNSINSTRLLGLALSNMELYFNGKVCIMAISRKMILDTNSTDEDIDNYVDKTLTISGVIMGIMMAEITDKDEIRVSIRSKGDVSARALAMQFSGGGHFNASGARIFNSDIVTAKSLILDQIQNIFSF